MTLQKFVVTADQMRQIETRIFAAGMPVAALMEKVAGLIATRIQELLKEEGNSATDCITDLTDTFYRDLEFGTGGLRGIMGAGSNRVNKYTIGAATQGLANYLKNKYPATHHY